MNIWDASNLRFGRRPGTFLRPVFWVAALISGPIVSGDTFVVSNTSDSGAGSLREAINDANGNAGSDTIEFNIPGIGPHTIQPSTGLPEITDTLIIDGYTQAGATPNTNPPDLGSNAVLKIELDGSNAGDASGLVITGANCTVKGLVVNRFALVGIYIAGTGASGNFVQGNFIGTDATGSADLGNALSGVEIQDAPDNTIGGAQAGERNVISGNNGSGIVIWRAGASGNVVQGNFIGTDVTGSADLGNGEEGVQIQNAPNNLVGGSQPGEGNVISGNEDGGIFLVLAGARGNVVQGNFIGTDVIGSADLGNALSGVEIQDAPENTIGGAQAGERNVISGNNGSGIFITSTGARGNVVQGNFIGTDVIGSADLGNALAGVQIEDAPENIIGGSQHGEGNLISGNDKYGIFIDGTGASGNVVQGNYIGIDVAGTSKLGNALSGVKIQETFNNTVGGSLKGEGNTISGNGKAGIEILRASGNLVRGNFIGTDVTGSADLGNALHGVVFEDALDNTVGGLQAGEANVISGNDDAGIFFLRGNRNVVLGNFIGTDATGSADLGNANDGVVMRDAPNNEIGGSRTGEGNVISGNGDNGIAVFGIGASGNSVRGNFIGTDATGSADLGNANDGVLIQDAPDNTIGGAQPGEGNVISGNDKEGVFIFGFSNPANASGNVVRGNFIGTDATGSSELGNASSGVRIEDAPSNTVGGAQPGQGNVISGNDKRGVFITGTQASGNVVRGNLIGTDRTGSAALGNKFSGVGIQNAPNNTIGGRQADAANVVSANNLSGIFVFGSESSGNIIQGNFIGTDVTGSIDLGNARVGVGIQVAPNSTIGGEQPGEGNVIAFNDLSGVAVGETLADTSVSISIRGNALYSNGSLGIDLAANSVSVNDSLDADTGPNNLQNFPVITSVLATESSTRIAGSLESAPNEEYTLDLYASSEADVSNHGEGERYLGSVMVMTDGLGEASFDVTLVEEARLGEYITATATDSMGSTSEFSEAVLLGEEGSGAPAPFESAVELGGGWWFSDWFGSLNINFLPWIFHPEHSWMYVFEESTSDDIFFYDLSLEGWLFTSSEIYPSMYSFGRNAWIFYFLETSGPRQFADLASGEFFSIP